MSYLDLPRLHFAGFFIADPSTINNDIDNYNEPTTGRMDPSWNPYGSHTWALDGAEVTGFEDRDGKIHTSGDPLIGAGLVNAGNGMPGKLVDLDTDQQGRTQLYGFRIAIELGEGKQALNGTFLDSGYLTNLWFGRVVGGSGDQAAGGSFQSLLSPNAWGDISGSPLLQQLRAAAVDGLSIRISTFGYDDSSSSTHFTRGRMTGSIGPWSKTEPMHIGGNRLFAVPLDPKGKPISRMWNAPAKIDVARKKLIVDFGNAIPESSAGGPPADLGTMRAALFPASGDPILLGTAPIDYSAEHYRVTAGITEIDLTPDQITAAGTTPLGILTSKGKGMPVTIGKKTWRTGLKEAGNGLYAAFDQASIRMEPSETTPVDLYAWAFGAPAVGMQLPLQLVPGGSTWNNDPASALQFPGSATISAAGTAQVILNASNPTPKPEQRKNVDGQVYFIGGPWTPTTELFEGAPLSVKIANSMTPVQSPTWTDVQPILYQYYVLYGYMASIVNLSNYASVKESAQQVRAVLLLPISDPHHMPVTRDMSKDARRMIIQWIDNGCPR
jgi:hypothetical protein